MNNQERPNSGIMFKNDRRTTDSHPHHNGRVNLDRDLIKWAAGEIAAGRPAQIDVAAWEKAGKKGTFLSLRVSVPRVKSSAPSRSGASGGDDDPPF